MPDLLGVTNPVPGHDNTQINRNIPISPNNTQVQNVPDTTRVTGADNRTEQQDAGQSGQIRYDSNFQTFLQQLRQTQGGGQILARLLAGEGTVVSSGMSEGIAEELSQVLEMLKVEDEGQLLQFLTEQTQAGTRFGGALFDVLRSSYARADHAGVRGDILSFLKSYSDWSSTQHLEGNLLRNLAAMADSMPASWGDKLRELLAQLENGVAAGDRQGNISLIQQRVFPFMSSYVAQTHDLGAPRGLLSLMALDLARYENGSEEKLQETFRQLAGYGTLKGMLGGIDEQALMERLESSQVKESGATQFADHLASAAARALRGEGSAEVQETFRNLVSSMLINESVYMPIGHFLIPLEMDGRKLFSELWVDADAEEKNGRGRGGRCMKLLFKIDVEKLGLFDVVMACRDNKEVEVAIACPEKAAPFSREIEQTVSRILVRNELTPAGIVVRRMERPVTLTEVFPKIFEGMNSINVKA